jgi:hypothetical protein
MNSPAAPSHDHERLSLGGALDLDLDVFSGPFDLLLTLVLREEVDLLGSSSPSGARLPRPPRTAASST